MPEEKNRITQDGKGGRVNTPLDKWGGTTKRGRAASKIQLKEGGTTSLFPIRNGKSFKYLRLSQSHSTMGKGVLVT